MAFTCLHSRWVGVTTGLPGNAATMSHKPPEWRVLQPDVLGSDKDVRGDCGLAGLHGIRLLPNVAHELSDPVDRRRTVAAVRGGRWLGKPAERAA